MGIELDLGDDFEMPHTEKAPTEAALFKECTSLNQVLKTLDDETVQFGHEADRGLMKYEMNQILYMVDQDNASGALGRVQTSELWKQMGDSHEELQKAVERILKLEKEAQEQDKAAKGKESFESNEKRPEEPLVPEAPATASEKTAEGPMSLTDAKALWESKQQQKLIEAMAKISPDETNPDKKKAVEKALGDLFDVIKAHTLNIKHPNGLEKKAIPVRSSWVTEDTLAAQIADAIRKNPRDVTYVTIEIEPIRTKVEELLEYKEVRIQTDQQNMAQAA